MNFSVLWKRIAIPDFSSGKLNLLKGSVQVTRPYIFNLLIINILNLQSRLQAMIMRIKI
jgi:hypothetical protein